MTCSVAGALIAPALSNAALAPVEQLGTAGTAAGQLGGPTGVAFDDAGNLYVSEYDNQRISVFSPSGEFLRAFGDGVDPDVDGGFEVCTTATGCQDGSISGGPGGLNNPAGMAFDGAGNLYIAEQSSNRVSVFDLAPTPTFLHAFGSNVDSGGGTGFEVCTTGCQPGSGGGGAGAVGSPYDIAIAGDGTIYVAEYGGHRVSAFSSTPEFLRALGKNVDSVSGGGGFEVCSASCQDGEGDSAEGSLYSPDGLAFDTVGNLHVVEYSNHRVSVIDPDPGSFVSIYGLDVAQAGGTGFEVCDQNCQAGSGNAAAPGSFGNPVGMLFDGDRTYVADQDGNHVVALTAAPGYLYTLGADVIPGGTTAFEICTTSTGCQTGGAGLIPGAVVFPQFMARDVDGRIYVAEYLSDRVEVFAEASFTLGKAKRNKRKGTAKLTVDVEGPGKVKLIKSNKIAADSASQDGTAGAVKLLVKARGAAKRKLNEEGSVRVRAKVKFTPLDGETETKSKRIKLKLN